MQADNLKQKAGRQFEAKSSTVSKKKTCLDDKPKNWA